VPFGYFKHINTPGLWYHESRPLSFTLIVNDFGVKYGNKDDVDHLVASIKEACTLTEDWTASQELKKVIIEIYCIKKCLLDLDPI
jgi:hypothetical protein